MRDPGSRPLLLRRGARYACYGDGLCCTDVHGLGPVSFAEKVQLGLVASRPVRHDPQLGHDVLSVDGQGRCCFLGDGGCRIYEAMGGRLKPRSCHRFPLGLTDTPRGWRVTMAYRCPCQTHSANAPELTLDRARALLEPERDGEDAAGHRVRAVTLRGGEEVPFETYLAMEEALLGTLEEVGAEARDEALPPLEGVCWEALGRGMAAGPVASRFDAALRFFGDALVRLEGGATEIEGRRPWADAFARAALRPAPPPEALLQSWLADLVWAMHWTDHATFAQFRRGLGVRGAVARQIAERIGGPTAWGEAVMVVDLVGSSPWWEAAEGRILASE